MGLFKGRDINKKTKKDMYYLQSLSLQHERGFCHYLDLSNPRKLIPHGDHLLKGCKCWREDRTVFAPKSA